MDAWQTYPVEFRGGLITNPFSFATRYKFTEVQEYYVTLNPLLKVVTDELRDLISTIVILSHHMANL